LFKINDKLITKVGWPSCTATLLLMKLLFESPLMLVKLAVVLFFNQFYKHQWGFELGASSIDLRQYNSTNQSWLLLPKHSTSINNKKTHPIKVRHEKNSYISNIKLDSTLHIYSIISRYLGHRQIR